MRAIILAWILLLATLLVRLASAAFWQDRPAVCPESRWQAAAPSDLGAGMIGRESRVLWHPRLLPPGHTRQHRNPTAHRRRRQRRAQQWLRRQPPVTRRQRRRPQQAVLRTLRNGTPPAPAVPVNPPGRPAERIASSGGGKARPQPTSDTAPTDPLADLRQGRGWIDLVPEAELWERLRRVRWANGLRCPHCGETDPTYLEVIDRHYRGGMYRYRCRVCARAGDPGEGGTFTDLSGTLFDGCRLDIRSLWLIVQMFVDQAAAVETADEVGVNRHTVDRYFRLLRGAIYQARPSEPMALGPEDIVEGDEVYITAGLKGEAGHRPLNRAPRRRGLKRRGRGTWESDRVPILGLLCRGGEVRLFTLRNVRTATLRPVIEQMVRQGARVYTDSYSAYHFLDAAGYRHATVNHGAGEYARGEVHCNTVECTWSWLRQALRTYRGVSKVYLPLYVAQFEFFYNRRHTSRWSQMIDVLQVAFQADAQALLARVDGAEFAEVCPLAD